MAFFPEKQRRKKISVIKQGNKYMKNRLSDNKLLQLKRWNTPTIYNGWEIITKRDRTKGFNLEETHDFMPSLGVMVGYAVTVVCEPSNPEHSKKEGVWSEYRKYIAGISGPKIVVVQDLDKPAVIGSFWGEVNANTHRALGCVGTITDGAVRDVEEMTNAGFKGIARRMCVGHAYVTPVRWGCEVDVFGCKIKPGDLIHADKHGFLVIPDEDQEHIVEASLFMDSNECNSVIPAARFSQCKSKDEVLESLDEADRKFDKAVMDKFGKEGEWK